jgi:hypothetical protein
VSDNLLKVGYAVIEPDEIMKNGNIKQYPKVSRHLSKSLDCMNVDATTSELSFDGILNMVRD